MGRRLGLLSWSAAVVVALFTAVPASSFAEGQSSVACAGATTATTSTPAGQPETTTTTTISPGSPPTPGDSCWTDVQPYPFGSGGGPVQPSSNPICVGLRNPGETCYLTVTSLAFRAWNRGL